jgi:hypothetical protein
VKAIQFNINNEVKVRLTLRGREIHKADYDGNFPEHLKEKYPYSPPEEDNDGFSKWQMWRLMNLFGPYLGLCEENPFDLTIRIPTE